MTEDEAIAFYIAAIATQVRSMPIREAVSFLRGALVLAGDHPAMRGIRGTFIDLSSADDQLELISSPQLRLKLDGDGKDGQ